MTLGDILKQYRIENSISMDEFVKKSSLSKGYISMLENNINPRNNKPIAPTLPTIRKVAIGMDMDVDTLLKRLDDSQEVSLQDDTQTSSKKKYFDEFELSSDEIDHIKKYHDLDHFGKETVSYILDRETSRVSSLKKQSERISKLEKATALTNIAPIRLINYYYRLASAGTGQILFDMPPTKRIEIPDLPEFRKADYAIGVNGNSMEPTYYDGDTLLVEMTDHIEIGEIGIFSVNNECFVKKLGHNELISLNPASSNIPLNETAHCMGRVIDKL